MRRWLFNLATAVSLVLGVGLASFWISSYWRDEQVGFANDRGGVWHIMTLESECGGLLLLYGDLTPKQPQPPGRWWHRSYGAVGPFKWGLMPSAGWTWQLRYVYVHYIWLIGATLLIPIMWAWTWYRRPRRSGHFCPTCGYDLQATPQRCPECGAVPAESRSTV